MPSRAGRAVPDRQQWNLQADPWTNGAIDGDIQILLLETPKKPVFASPRLVPISTQ
jgi:hypothetical protein